MKILVLLMFLASLGFSMGLTDDELHEKIDRARFEQELARPYGAEFVESASPACQGIATTLAECNDPKGKRLTEAPRRCSSIGLKRVCIRVPDPRPCPVSMVSFLHCERKELQRQLLEVQEQLVEMQESASGVTSTTERRKLGLNWGFKYGALTAPLYLNRAIKKALQELRESQCQQAEDGDV